MDDYVVQRYDPERNPDEIWRKKLPYRAVGSADYHRTVEFMEQMEWSGDYTVYIGQPVSVDFELEVDAQRFVTERYLGLDIKR